MIAVDDLAGLLLVAGIGVLYAVTALGIWRATRKKWPK